eukprot:gene1896-2230_t
MSKQRNLRSKLSFDNDEATDAVPAPPINISKQKDSNKKDSTKSKTAALLSFGDDEESVVAKLKSRKDKSTVSKFHRSNLAAAPAPATHRQSGGEYTSEKLAALQATTQKLPARLKPAAAGDSSSIAAEVAADGVIKLSGSFKKAAKESDDRFTYSYNIHGIMLSAVSAAAPGHGRRSAAPAGRPTQADEDADGANPSAGDESDDGGYALPDQATIRLAKAKRERLRQAHLAPDYLPLGGASRLIGSGAGGVMGPGSSMNGSNVRGRREVKTTSDEHEEALGFGSGSDHDHDSGSDADGDLEEQTRMRFVGQQPGVAPAAEAGSRRGTASNRNSKVGTGSASAASAVAAGDYATTPALAGDVQRQFTWQAAQVVQDDALLGSVLVLLWHLGKSYSGAEWSYGESVLEALLEACNRANSRQRQLEANLQRTKRNLAGALAEADQVRADILAAGEKYAAVQALKSYLADLAECLAAKAVLVEELQDALSTAREEAAAALRQQQQVDEFGRDLSRMNRQQLVEGSTRRKVLMQQLLLQISHMQEGGKLDLEESMLPCQQSASSAAEHAPQPEAVQQYQRRRQEVLDVAPTVFADADEQFASLAAVKTKLEAFKHKYPKEYSTAYLGESAAALFAPFVRLELLHWEPLPLLGSCGSSSAAGGKGLHQSDAAASSFDAQSWYLQLFEYGLLPAAGSDGAPPAAAAAVAGGEDADSNLVPQLVESLILPLALSLSARCWDPFQVAQSRAVVSLVSDLFVYVSADKEDMAQLLALTTGALEAGAAAAVVPPWPSAAVAASPIAQAVVQLRFRRCAALLQSFMGFKELLSQQLLFKLVLQGLVTQQLVPCLRASTGDLGVAIARAEVVVQSLPVAWFSEGAVSHWVPWNMTVESAYFFKVSPLSQAPAHPPQYLKDNHPQWPFVGGDGFLIVSKYSDSPAGPYSEVVYLPGKFEISNCSRKFWSVSRIWVDSPVAWKAGRTVWGFPKVLGAASART